MEAVSRTRLHPAVVPGTVRFHPPAPRTDGPEWSRVALAGRVCELSSVDGAGQLTMAFHLLLDAQREGEPVAWILGGDGIFYPPDVAAWGIDLDALPVVRASGPKEAARAAELLLRSGGFGLVVLDLVHPGRDRPIALPTPLLARWVRQARAQDAVLLCLTTKPPWMASLGSLVSWRGQVVCRRVGRGRFDCSIRVEKDKRHGPGWRVVRRHRGPDGMC